MGEIIMKNMLIVIVIILACSIGIFVNNSLFSHDVEEQAIASDISQVEDTDEQEMDEQEMDNDIDLMQNDEIRIASFSSSHRTYESEEEMYDTADLIVIGKINSDYIISEENSYVQGSMANLDLTDYYSLAPFMIFSTLKGHCESESFNLLQPVAITRDPLNNLVKIGTRGYVELTKNDYYMLYLLKVDSLENTYGMLGIYYGKINLGTLELNKIMNNTDIYASYYYDKYDGDTDLVNSAQLEAINKYKEQIEEFAMSVNED